MSFVYGSNISGRNLVADGVKIDNITTSSNNTGIGINAGAAPITSGVDNVFVGVDSLGALTTGSRNTALGDSSLQVLVGGNNNTAVGNLAMPAATSASSCVVVGRNAASSLTTGNSNVVVGSAAGSNLVSGATNTLLGVNTNVSSATSAGRIAIGAAAVAQVDNGLYFPTTLANTGGAGVPVRYVAASGLMGPESSSIRFKENVEELETNPEMIYYLQPKSYNFKKDPEGNKDTPRIFGYIAEEVVKVIPEIVGRDEHGLPFGLNYDMLVVLIIEELKKIRMEIAR